MSDRHPWTWSYQLDMEQLLSGSFNDQVIAFGVDRNDVLREPFCCFSLGIAV